MSDTRKRKARQKEKRRLGREEYLNYRNEYGAADRTPRDAVANMIADEKRRLTLSPAKDILP